KHSPFALGSLNKEPSAKSKGESDMAKKFDFDWKNFLLQKGEKIGLGVGAAVGLLMLVFGIMHIYSGGSPSAKAEDLNKKTQVVQNLLVNNKPRDTKEFEVDPTLLTTQANLEQIKP